MKYLKYSLVDALTGDALDPEQDAPNGRKHPNIDNLDVKIPLNDGKIFLATCPDQSSIPQNSGVQELTVQEFTDLLEQEFIKLKGQIIKEIYDMAKELRQTEVDSWYHSSEITFAASTKIEEALAADAAQDDAAADAAAPYLAQEATRRGVTTKTLATKVIQKYNDFKNQEAIFAGTRGSKVDAVTSITFDSNNPMTSINQLLDQQNSIDEGWS